MDGHCGGRASRYRVLVFDPLSQCRPAGGAEARLVSRPPAVRLLFNQR